jgi:hypothetical protein
MDIRKIPDKSQKIPSQQRPPQKRNNKPTGNQGQDIVCYHHDNKQIQPRLGLRCRNMGIIYHYKKSSIRKGNNITITCHLGEGRMILSPNI